MEVGKEKVKTKKKVIALENINITKRRLYLGRNSKSTY